MLNVIVRQLAILAGGLILSFAAIADRHLEVDGMHVYLGIAPSTHITTHPWIIPAGHPIDASSNAQHVLVALFDTASGKRITDAKIGARVAALGMGGPDKVMHGIEIASQMTYCNFFEMDSRTTYSIDLRIERPGSTRVSTARFIKRP